MDVRLADGRFDGSVDPGHAPQRLRQLFGQFEEIVGGQMLSLLDDIEDRVCAAGLRVVFADGTEAVADDLQIYPTTGAVSFAVRHPAAVR